VAADEIHIAELELRARIGVTEAERETPQRLTVSMVLEPVRGFDSVHDDLAQTVNYSAVCRLVRALAGAEPRRLLETLALEIAGAVLTQFECASAEIELRKYILPDTKYVAVRIVRHRKPNP
jgi:dihydroneopterin aldolase